MSVPFVNESFHAAAVPPAQMDALWAAGWRHFGAEFFRYSMMPSSDGRWLVIQPLRVVVAGFVPNKSQRRVLRKNADLHCTWGPAGLDGDLEAMFQRHKGRFTENVPEGLGVFFSDQPATVPCRCQCLRVWKGARLVAASFLDEGEHAASSVYGIFEPEESWRSLGIYTMLKEMEHVRSTGRRWYYPGYATREPSHYDYKKQFATSEYLDWGRGWVSLGGD